MSRLIIILCFFTSSLMVNSQPYKTFEDEQIIFNYPSSFKPNPIKDSPGMKLKLVSDSYGLYISYMDTKWDESTSIWDDRISGRLFNDYSGNGYIVNKAKVSIHTKDGVHQCLKLMTNTQKIKQGVTFNLRNLSYLMLYKGKLFIIGFISDGKYTRNSSTEYPEKILKGIQLKGKEKSEEHFDKYLLETTKQLNSQCPMRIDNCTTHMSVLLTGKNLMIKTIVLESCENLVNYEEFKSRMCENFSVALDKPFVQYLDKHGYSMIFMIYNEFDRLKKKVTINGRDILNYYH